MRIERVWAMPSPWTFTIRPVKTLLAEEGVDESWLDPFAGLHSPAAFDNRNDLNPSMPTAAHMDALQWLRERRGQCEGVLFDPPYSITQAKQCYDAYGSDVLDVSVTNMRYWARVKDEMCRLIRPGGKAVCCGWSSMGLGKGRGFTMTRVLLVPHGGSKNDTIVTVEVKNV